jgi:hypothetical protein
MKAINLCAHQLHGTKRLNGLGYVLGRTEQRACPFCFPTRGPLASNNADERKTHCNGMHYISLHLNLRHQTDKFGKELAVQTLPLLLTGAEFQVVR